MKTMASVGRSGRAHTKERWSWVKEPSAERVFGDRRDRQRTDKRRNSTPIWRAISKRGFEELIPAIHNMIGAINSMQKRMTWQWGGDKDLKERTPKRHDRRDQKGYQWDQDEREASRTAKRVEEHGCRVEGGLGHPHQAEEGQEMPR